VVALAASCFFFALMALCARMLTVRGFGYAELVTWRMGIGAVGCLPFLLAGHARFRPERLTLMLVRCLAGAVAVLLYFYSLQHLEVGLATLFNYLGPLFTTLFAAYFLSERPSPRTVLGMTLAFGGMALTVRAMPHPSALSVGAIAGLLSAVGQGGAVTAVRALRQSEEAFTIYFWFCVVTMICTLPLGWGHFHAPTAADLPLLLGIGVASLCAQLLFNDALGYVPAATGALVSPLTPAIAFVLGALVLGEPLSWKIALAATVAIAGVVLGTWTGAGRALAVVVRSGAQPEPPSPGAT
jgi:drug/metabolite transporter (DMT)-like permease